MASCASCHTDDLLVFSEQSDASWFVLHTKPRQEKALADGLGARGINFFLPLSRQVRYYGRRCAVVEMPLFPSYLFVRGSLEEAYEADRTTRVVSIIRVADQKLISWELRNLYLALSRNAVVAPYPHLARGTKAEVHAGPFRGLQGIVTGEAGCNRLILQVQTLGQAVSLEIDASLLEAIE